MQIYWDVNRVYFRHIAEGNFLDAVTVDAQLVDDIDSAAISNGCRGNALISPGVFRRRVAQSEIGTWVNQSNSTCAAVAVVAGSIWCSHLDAFVVQPLHLHWLDVGRQLRQTSKSSGGGGGAITSWIVLFHVDWKTRKEPRTTDWYVVCNQATIRHRIAITMNITWHEKMCCCDVVRILAVKNG